MPFLYEKEKVSPERSGVEPNSQRQSTHEKQTESKNPPTAHARTSSFWPQIYRRLGFTKAYNFWLFLVFSTGMLFFTLARLKYLDLDGAFARGVSPGDWYYYRRGWYRWGIAIHLFCILPVGLLMPWQFVPKLRNRYMPLHRFSGYTIFLLTTIGNVGALMIMRRSFGGGIDSQSAVVVLATITEIGIAMAWYNIRKLQIDQHRAWMIRTMFYLGAIVSTRIVMPIAVLTMTWVNSYYSVMTCDQMRFIFSQDTDWSKAKPRGELERLYPQCAMQNGTNQDWVAVKANFEFGKPEGIGAAFDMTFGMGVTERLRRISYKRQLDAGFEKPGSAGTTIQGWGDAPEWTPPGQRTSTGN
ncbi:MAG: hypothetical protein LQ342_006322 [Letrouitia transgressa]|nr:MAG: hypothetical protein LQ342_006322 [Letrouitia transgressa]